ncbi:MAG: TetR/AcrR family transcriptional regulator [Olsenella profusa]
MDDFDGSILPGEDNAFRRLPEERRDAIARASIEAFGRNDYKSASTDDIARSAGISKGLLFFYCKSKRQLYLRTMEYLYDRAVEVAVKTASGGSTTSSSSWSMPPAGRWP